MKNYKEFLINVKNVKYIYILKSFVYANGGLIFNLKKNDIDQVLFYLCNLSSLIKYRLLM